VKQFLTNDPVLRITDTNNDIVVCTNAYKEGLGGVLMQEDHVVAMKHEI